MKHSMRYNTYNVSRFWIVLDSDNNALRKIDSTDVEEIQIHKTNWVTTSILLAVVI